MITTTWPNLNQLQVELTAAGVVIPALGAYGRPPVVNVHTYDQNGRSIDLPTGAAPILAAHVPIFPALPDYGGDLQTSAEFATQAATAVSNLRAYLALESPTQVQTVAVIRLLCRIAIYSIRRWLGG